MIINIGKNFKKGSFMIFCAIYYYHNIAVYMRINNGLASNLSIIDFIISSYFVRIYMLQ